jgi:diadenosine tetraphosphate (Ap4A) HIT family hydrolase
VVWEDDLWFVRHIAPPYPLAGWTMFHTQRHVQGPAHFNDVEAARFGPVLRHVTKALEQATGALRIYVVAFGESTPHMHAHLIPRYEKMPKDLVAFGVADIMRGVPKGELPAADPKQAAEVVEKLRQSLKKNPPPK